MHENSEREEMVADSGPRMGVGEREHGDGGSGGWRWLTVVVYAATNIYLSTQRGSHYHPVPSLRRKRHAYPSERLTAGRAGKSDAGRGWRATGAKRIIKAADWETKRNEGGNDTR